MNDFGSISVTECAGLATFQDLGRPGYAHLAVPRSGAFDMQAHTRANRIVGNESSAATIEILRGAITFVPATPCIIALTGAPVSVQIGNVEHEMDNPIVVKDGVSVKIATVNLAMRTYLAVRGGFIVQPVLGSRSFDELSQLGPPPIHAGDHIPVGVTPTTDIIHVGLVPVGAPLQREVAVRAFEGPRWNLIDAASQLFTEPFQVTSEVNRVGIRLAGHRFSWPTSERLPSEPIAHGSIQVPANGFPIMFGPDHPTTGGYPVIAVVHPDDMGILAQLAPETIVRFQRAH